MAARNTMPRPLLREGACYWADNGRVICAKCAGQSALYTGRDISGQRVERITVEDVRAWPEDLGILSCTAGCTALTAIAGPDGWPLERGTYGEDRPRRTQSGSSHHSRPSGLLFEAPRC